MTYEDKVRHIHAPIGRRAGPLETRRFVLVEKPPYSVVVAGTTYRIEIETEPVSGELRLVAIDTAQTTYRAWLLAIGGDPAKLEKTVYSTGIELSQDKGGFAVFRELVREGKAREIGRAD